MKAIVSFLAGIIFTLAVLTGAECPVWHLSKGRKAEPLPVNLPLWADR